MASAISALVTGANRGIGLAVARQLLGLGWAVWLSARDEARAEAGSLASMGTTQPGYATSKAALNALTRLLAAQLRSQGTLVNAVCPGWTATDMGGGRPVDSGAASVVWAATLPANGPTGGFFRNGRALPW